MHMHSPKIGPIASLMIGIMAALLFQPGSAAGTSILWTDKSVYGPDETIQVMFSNATGKDSDWICIVPAGAPDTDGGDYQYMPSGVSRGSLTFAPRPPGEYEARAYYDYRRNGYVVSGRYPFSVAGDPDGESWDQEAADTYAASEPLPPAVGFVEPPNVVVLPGTDVYAVPDIEVDLFFQGGWWWRLWGGRWYRSRYHDRGWAYYRNPPSWYIRIPGDWRHRYRTHIWGSHPWNPPRIRHDNLNDHWRGGRWRDDDGWKRPGKSAPPANRPGVAKPGKPAPPRVGPGGGRPGGSPSRPAGPGGGKPGVGKPGGGGQGGGPSGTPPPRVGPGGGRTGDGPGRSSSPGLGRDGGQRGGRPAEGSGRAPLRGFGFENRPQTGGR